MTSPLQSYPLPYAFPDGTAWAAIRAGVVVNMIYMEVPAGVSFDAHREASRATLAKHGIVWTGKVAGGCFMPRFESTDTRRAPT